MYPQLAAMSGPLQGKTFALDQTEVTIGRDASNPIVINSVSVSRRHCLLRRDIASDGVARYQLSDLESLNGTFVNDLPTTARALTHGDRIRIGDSLFLFLQHEGETAATPDIQFDDSLMAAQTTTTTQLRLDDAFALIARDFHALMKLSRTLNTADDLLSLQAQLLELIFEAVPAERGAVLLADDAREERYAGFFRQSAAAIASEEAFRISRTVVQRVLHEGISLLVDGIQDDAGFLAIESIQTTGTRSLLCVPLLRREQVMGAIYLDARDINRRFTEDHLQLLTAIANVAAIALENAQHIERLESENELLRADAQLAHDMVGDGARMREIYQIIGRVAPSETTVLIRGESGTGKELAARAVHLNSSRRAKPFIAINCAALTETLLESELFGHEKGAFTGAIAQKKGKLEAGEGGTIFLDEVGELSPPMQAKLLRVLQEREFERVGGTRPIKINIRIIAATNRNLEEAIKDGTFRADLYYRLNVVSLVMPPLRERPEDILLLANYFAAVHSKKCNRTLHGISSQARALLTNYAWPGNVRELENAIERAVVLGASDTIRPEDLPETLTETESIGAARPVVGATQYHESVREMKKQLLLKAMGEAAGSYTEAAKLLGVHPNYLHRLMRNFNLRPQ